MGRIVEAIQLPGAWLDAVLGKINLRDVAKRVEEKRIQVTDRLKRLGRAYIDGMVVKETTAGGSSSWRWNWRSWLFQGLKHWRSLDAWWSIYLSFGVRLT